MPLRLLEPIQPENRIKPGVEQITCPLPPLDYHRARIQPLFILRQHKLDSLCRYVAVCLDDAVGRDDGYIAAHELCEALGSHDVGFDGERGVHDDAIGVKEEEGACVGEGGHGVAESGDAGPAAGDRPDGIVAGRLDKETVACWC